MADGKTYIVPTDAEPTMWNKEAFIGTFVLPIPILGTLVGGMIGKARMEREREYGKPVDPPSIWNKTSVIGAIVSLIPAVITYGIVSALAGPVAGTLAMVGVEGVGALIGGAMGKGRLEKEYKEAGALVTARDQLNIAKGKSPGRAVSPELAEKLASGFNGGTMLGMYVGGLTSSAISLSTGTPLPENATRAEIISSFTSNLGMSAALEAGGGVAGSLVGKSKQAQRYLQGDVVTREEALEVKYLQMQAQAGAMVPQRANQISPEEARLLEARLAQAQGNMQDKVSQLRDIPHQPGVT